MIVLNTETVKRAVWNTINELNGIDLDGGMSSSSVPQCDLLTVVKTLRKYLNAEIKDE